MLSNALLRFPRMPLKVELLADLGLVFARRAVTGASTTTFECEEHIMMKTIGASAAALLLSAGMAAAQIPGAGDLPQLPTPSNGGSSAVLVPKSGSPSATPASPGLNVRHCLFTLWQVDGAGNQFIYNYNLENDYLVSVNNIYLGTQIQSVCNFGQAYGIHVTSNGSSVDYVYSRL